MKLLVVTQVIDQHDPTLGFFHRWAEELASRYDQLEIICLKEGVHSLPQNVQVHSLGKEKGIHSRLSYSLKFIAYVWSLRNSYDAVFVHMNQEYILIAGWLFTLLRKPVYLWRNHYRGSWLTDFAAAFCRKVFCTSERSYTANYTKTTLMPVGVDLEQFTETNEVRIPRSLLFFGRMAPSKRPELFISALTKLIGEKYTATIVGSPKDSDQAFYEALKAFVTTEGLGDHVTFVPAMPHAEVPALFRRHEWYINLSPSGMFDKALFEASACGTLVLTTSADFVREAGERFSCAAESNALAHKISEVLAWTKEEQDAARALLKVLALRHSLSGLGKRIQEEVTR